MKAIKRQLLAMPLALSATIVALCFTALAQQPKKIPRIGFLNALFPTTNPARIEAFRQGLRDFGYVEGKNIIIEYRYAERKVDRLPTLAAELVRLKVDFIHERLTRNPCGEGCDEYNPHCHDQ